MYNEIKYPSCTDKEGENMDLQLKKWYRPLAGGAIFLLLAVIAGAWHADEAEKPPLVLQKGNEEEARNDTTTEIAGLQQADAHKELRNPFSMLHETEQASHRKVPSVGQMPQTENSKQQANVPLAAAQNDSQPQSAGTQSVVLCGIVEGSGQRLALLRIGTNTVTAGVGEMAADWLVTAIDTAAVTVERSGQVLNLPLTMTSEAGAK